MKTPFKALRLAHVALIIGLLAHSNIGSAQTDILPGETVNGEFVVNHHTDEYTVKLTAGDRLLIDIQTKGVTLKTSVSVFDPGHPRRNQVQYWGPAVTHDHQSIPLSADGLYLIQVSNTRGVGVYTISVGRIDLRGNPILPRSSALQ